MISTQEELDTSRDALSHLESALSALRQRVEESNPALFGAMASSYVEHIHALRREIDEYIGLRAAEERLLPLSVVLQGERLSRENVSSRVLTDWLERIRKGIYRVTDYLENGAVTSRGRPNRELLRATDPYVLSVQPGSLRIGLRLPSAQFQSELLGSRNEPERPASHTAVAKILELLEWAANSQGEELPQGLGDQDEMVLIAVEAKRWVPTKNGPVQAVRYSGTLSPTSTPLTIPRGTDSRLTGLIELLTTSSEQTVRGVIREIDLDLKRFMLRERGPGMSDLRCFFPTEMLSVAEASLGAAVTVVGLVSSLQPHVLHVAELVLDDSQDERNRG